MNMNTGRGMLDDDNVITNQDDIWSLENLENLIDLNIDVSECWSDETRLNYADSVNMKEEVGGGFLHASCVAVKKMIIFAVQAINQ